MLKKNCHSLLGLSSKVFTFDHLSTHRSDFFNNLAISLTEWPEYRKNRCLSSSTNSVGLQFRENKRKRQKYENRNPTKWAGKIWWGKTHVRVHLGQKF